jgi:hypothetical protein
MVNVTTPVGKMNGRQARSVYNQLANILAGVIPATTAVKEWARKRQAEIETAFDMEFDTVYVDACYYDDEPSAPIIRPGILQTTCMGGAEPDEDQLAADEATATGAAAAQTSLAASEEPAIATLSDQDLAEAHEDALAEYAERSKSAVPPTMLGKVGFDFGARANSSMSRTNA